MGPYVLNILLMSFPNLIVCRGSTIGEYTPPQKHIINNEPQLSDEDISVDPGVLKEMAKDLMGNPLPIFHYSYPF